MHHHKDKHHHVEEDKKVDDILDQLDLIEQDDKIDDENMVVGGYDDQPKNLGFGIRKIQKDCEKDSDECRTPRPQYSQSISLTSLADSHSVLDPCANHHCSTGKQCDIDDEGKPTCVCIRKCPEEVDIRRKVCSNFNDTWDNDCELYRMRCLCDAGSEHCLKHKYKHAHVDYYGACRDIESCSEDEMADFPRRMREWLFNVMKDMADRNELDQTYLAMEREAEKSIAHKWVNAVIWKFCDLDTHPHDRSVSRHELFPIRAPLMAMEHCIAPFLDGCDANDDHHITLLEWGSCLGLEEVFHDHLHPGRKSPKPFEPEEEEMQDGCISGKQFHNYFYDGSHAPLILNPVYMLIIDCRDEEDYNRGHILTAHWFASQDLHDPSLDLGQYSLIILYNQDGSAPPGASIWQLQRTLTDTGKKLEPVIIYGGFAGIAKNFPYMITKLELTVEERASQIDWYPSVIVDNTLYLGRSDQARNRTIVETLGITHVINLTSNPEQIFPDVTYLCYPVTNSKDGTLLHYFSEICKRIEGAINSGGRVLVHCNNGVNAGATVVISYLMYQKACTVEDAHYYVKALRPIIQPNEHYLKELSEFEAALFGRKITSIDDLWF
uniref:protein-tyrosine-phosphatase n=1 Tax=Strigamia maritima TaxID=126957 RepID=T1JEP3_STRMM